MKNMSKISKNVAGSTSNTSKSTSSQKISNYFFTSMASQKRSAEDLKDDASTSDATPTKLLKNSHFDSCKIFDSLSAITKNKLNNFSYSKISSNVECYGGKYSEFDTPGEASKIPNFSSCASLHECPENVNEDEESESMMHDSELIIDKNAKYTPLENQYFDFKNKYPGLILLIECGYKYRFFDKDAKIASKELNISCIKHHNLYSAIIPSNRLHIHVQRLVSKNYKVGVIKQTESAVMKDNKNALFSRKLHAIYTKSTLIGNEFSAQSGIENIDIGSGFLACIFEEQSKDGKNSPTNIAVLAIQTSSGDMFYSCFQDVLHRPELEAILLQINPSEIIYPKSGLSNETEHLLNFTFSHGLQHLRLEQLDYGIFDYTFAMNKVSEFYESRNAEVQDQQNILADVFSLPPLVVCCLAALIVYLTDFKLEKILKNINCLKPFNKSSENVMLNAAAVRSLELFRNAATFSEQGSFLSVLNKTVTRFGERLLKLWISRPLNVIEEIEERLNVVTEIIQSKSPLFNVLEKSLCKLPDLEKMLCAAFYHRCSCSEFLSLINCFKTLKNELLELSNMIEADVNSSRLKHLFSETLTLISGIENISNNINEEAAREEDKLNIFVDTTMFSAVEDCKKQIQDLIQKLDSLKKSICKTLRLPAFKYSTVSGQKYLIQIPISLVPLVPNDWIKINGTKQVSRFRSPEVTQLLYELEKRQAILKEASEAAWHTFLEEFGKSFYKLKKAVLCLAELDCYLCYAKFAKEEHFCRPLVSDDSSRVLDIQHGRNLIAMKLLGEDAQFVANDTKLNHVARCMIITGPNMGGKSTYIRQVALLVMLAHMGCYVPADSATIPLCDGIYVRMGADDDLDSNRSTFMNEMSETADILASATSKSLIILDELGRGTSTHDGSLVANATLDYLISEVNCLVFFVTHYPQVVDLQSKFPENIITTQMAFVIEDSGNNGDIESLAFLYNLTAGVSEKSYGINVARLAQIPKHLLLKAQKKSQEFAQQLQQKRKMANIMKTFSSLPRSEILNKLNNFSTIQL